MVYCTLPLWIDFIDQRSAGFESMADSSNGLHRIPTLRVRSGDFTFADGSKWQMARAMADALHV
jgi:hypothetical protein